MKKKVLDNYDLEMIKSVVDRMLKAPYMAEKGMKENESGYAFGFGYLQGMIETYALEIEGIIERAKTIHK